MLHKELEILFGKEIVKEAGQVDPSRIDAPSVNQAVGALLHLQGQPAAQMAYVRQMPQKEAAVLCRWLGDQGFWKAAAGVQTH